MRETIYIETSVLSYYTALPSRAVLIKARQEITRRFWLVLPRYDVYVSQVVEEEAAMGDAAAAGKRLHAMSTFPRLAISAHAEALARRFLRDLNIPEKAFRDALHLGIAAAKRIDYLVTWNCTHLANPHVLKNLNRVQEERGLYVPVICTPEQLLEA